MRIFSNTFWCNTQKIKNLHGGLSSVRFVSHVLCAPSSEASGERALGQCRVQASTAMASITGGEAASVAGVRPSREQLYLPQTTAKNYQKNAERVVLIVRRQKLTCKLPVYLV